MTVWHLTAEINDILNKKNCLRENLSDILTFCEVQDMISNNLFKQ